MKAYLEKLLAGESLSQNEAFDAFNIIMSGEAAPSLIAGFLVALRMKGESVEEVAGGAQSMRSHALQIDVQGAGDLPIIDVVGTGGDGLHTFNVSTTAAFVAAGAGLKVAKHGNRAISSKSGAADVLGALGVNLDAGPETVERCIREAGVGFLFAPKHHPAMKHAMGPRKELGIRTIFNMLGPLTNPANAPRQLIGVFAPELTELFAGVLQRLGGEVAWIVHGYDGMDELTTTTKSVVSELRGGQISTFELDPALLVGALAQPADLAGGDAETNAAITRAVLSGAPGPTRDIVCLNAAAAILVGGIAGDIEEGWTLACESIDSGKASAALEALVRITQEAS